MIEPRLFVSSHGHERRQDQLEPRPSHNRCFSSLARLQTTFFFSQASHSSLPHDELVSWTTPSKTTVGVTCTPIRRFILVTTFMSLVTWLPMFSAPSSPGLSGMTSIL